MLDIITGYRNLLSAMNEKCEPEYRDEDMQMICDEAKHFADYVKCVYDEEFENSLAREKYKDDPAVLRQCIMDTDRRRRIIHDAAIASCSILNRACDRFGTEKFCPETDDRIEIADFCARATNEIFWNNAGSVNGMQEARDYALAHAVPNRGKTDKILSEIKNHNPVKEKDDQIEL